MHVPIKLALLEETNLPQGIPINDNINLTEFVLKLIDNNIHDMETEFNVKKDELRVGGTVEFEFFND